MNEAGTSPAPSRRSGSERRRKQKRIIFRVTVEEYDAIEAAAERAGLTLASYVRQCAAKTPRSRARRRIQVDVLEVCRLQGAMNKVGGNIQQILKRVHFGETPEGIEYREALQGYREVIAAILETLGRGRR